MVVRVWHKAFAVWLAIVSAAFAGTEHYDYDALGRLIRFVGPDGRVTEYVYDGVGNILEVRDITGPPAASLALTSVSRDSVRRRQSVPVSVAGNALLGATVTSPDASLLVSDLRSNPSEVHFNLGVAETAPLGPHTFTLSSRSVRPISPSPSNRGFRHWSPTRRPSSWRPAATPSRSCSPWATPTRKTIESTWLRCPTL